MIDEELSIYIYLIIKIQSSLFSHFPQSTSYNQELRVSLRQRLSLFNNIFIIKH
jgi:hypothetical protein